MYFAWDLAAVRTIRVSVSGVSARREITVYVQPFQQAAVTSSLLTCGKPSTVAPRVAPTFSVQKAADLVEYHYSFTALISWCHSL